MPDFKPAEDYETLLKQAKALASLVNAMESELSLLRRQVDPVRLADLEQQINSERAANERLTNELAGLQDTQITETELKCGGCRQPIMRFRQHGKSERVQKGFLLCDDCFRGLVAAARNSSKNEMSPFDFLF